MVSGTDAGPACNDEVCQLIHRGITNTITNSNTSMMAVDSKSAKMRVVQFLAVTVTESCATAVVPNTHTHTHTHTLQRVRAFEYPRSIMVLVLTVNVNGHGH